MSRVITIKLNYKHIEALDAAPENTSNIILYPQAGFTSVGNEFEKEEREGKVAVRNEWAGISESKKLKNRAWRTARAKNSGDGHFHQMKYPVVDDQMQILEPNFG